MAGLQLDGISKSFGDTPVLNGIDLSIKDGEFLTLVGPSGCGKSTLLRIIAGLEAQDQGAISIGGSDVSGVRAADRNLAMVFQSYALYPHLTVAQNMLTPLKLRDLSWHQRLPILGPLLARQPYKDLMGQVRETAEILKIEALLDRKPGQMSGGQRQRAALGRAMVRKPVAFLMDEPLSNLDAALRVHMRTELADLHRSLETTFIYVTHDQSEAMTMSNRMAVMMNGDILQLDTPDEVYSNPNHVDVATFVGSPKINLLDAETQSDGSVNAHGSIVGHATGTVSKVGVRSEHVGIATAKDSNSWRATIRNIENLGSDLYLHCSLGDGAEKIIVRTGPSVSHAIGDTILLKANPDKLMAFGADKKRVAISPVAVPSAKTPEVAA